MWQVVKHNNTLKLNLNRNITATWSVQFREHIQALDLNGIIKVTLNFEDVDMIDSFGIGMLVYLNQQVPTTIPIEIINTKKQVEMILKAVHMPQLLASRKQSDQTKTE